MTRSSIKPRLLFPPQPQEPSALEEEEADTDVEIEHLKKTTEPRKNPRPTTVVEVIEESETPKAPRFSSISPPDTRRVTRARDKKFDEPNPVQRQGRTSPFDSWPRVKSRSESSLPSKRPGSSLSSSTAKKARP